MKQLPANYQKETAGVLAISTFANRRNWIWRPTIPPDTGIDGTIEIAAVGTGVTGRQLGIQSKSGRSYIRGETEGAFHFYSNASDVEYWNGHSLPVLLFVFDTVNKRLYALSIKDYLRDHPEARSAPYRLLFDKRLDRVTDAAHAWMRDAAIGTPRSYRKRRAETLKERLHTNLLLARPPFPVIFSAAVTKPFERPMPPLEPGLPLRPIFVERENRCWSFGDLRSDISFDDHLDQSDIRPWAWNELLSDEARSSYLFELLYSLLRRHMRGLPIGFDRIRKRHYFLPDNTSKRTWDYKSQLRKAKRMVAAPFGDKGYWFHHSAKLTWHSLGALMLLKIIPGYVFTKGGTAIMGDEDVIRLNVKKRKREYNKQVFQHLIFWREVLARGSDRIAIETGGGTLTIDKDFVSQNVSFGIFDDPGSFAQLTEPDDEAIDETDFEDEQDIDGGPDSLQDEEEP
jgi:hypothetical protein